ncbi:oligosaccharide flippase family protein [Candidatus Woesebacteria bacterium]|nr:oligosaccharide flippase family protein [Candidatus Woesebacteria bacterium]
MKYFTKFLTLVRLAIIARILGPEQLGLFGLSVLVISVTEVFTETGINVVLLKQPKKFAWYYDTAWVVSLFRGTLISLGILLCAPLLAQFYDQPSLTYYLSIAAIIPFLRGFINPAIVQFQQRLQFERESALRIGVQVIDLVLGGVLAIWLQNGIGLLLGIAAAVVAEVILSFSLFPERPNLLKAQWSRVVSLFQESKYIIGTSIVHYLTENIDDFLIGKYLGFTALGFYQTAYKLASAATMDFGSIVGQTLYPMYAQKVERKKSITKTWQFSVVALTVVFLFAAVPFLFFTQPLVYFVLGEEWLVVTPIVRILFLAGVAKAFITSWNPLSILANNLQHHFVMNIIMMFVLILGIVFLAPRYGLPGASWAVFFAFVVVHPYAWFVLRQALRRISHAR